MRRSAAREGRRPTRNPDSANMTASSPSTGAQPVRGTFDTGEGGSLRLRLEGAGHNAGAYFRSQSFTLQPNNESILAAGLLPCMQAGRSLAVEGAVSRRMLDSLPTFMEIFHGWHPHLKPVEILGARPVERSRKPGARVGILFSGGVDTFYSLLMHQQHITDLIFVRGFDMELDELATHERALAMVHETAAHLGKGVVEVETDLRPYLTGLGLRWGMHSHGPFLASIGHLLYPEFGTLYIATSMYYARIVPWSSHPLLDPLWGTEGLEFIHDGLEARRPDKVRMLAEHDWVLQALRVCSRNPQTKLNCGRCEKCIRTMLSLEAAGALERCPTFETPLDPGRVRRLEMKRAGTLNYAQMNLDALRAAGGKEPLIRALQSAMKRSRRKMRAREFMQRRLPDILAFIRRLRRGSPASSNPAADNSHLSARDRIT